MRSEWDTIIAGGSFGGLAAAMELARVGRVLIVDRKPVGEGETSACGTLLRVLERLEATEALEQVHDRIVLHLPSGREYAFRPRYRFATFDYRKLCHLLAERTDATFLEASVVGMEDEAVLTTRGRFRAPIVIDASGWRAALGSSIRPDTVPTAARSVGVEVRVPVREEGLHFWVLPKQIGCGVTWLFPAGEVSRAGIACYLGKGSIKSGLEEFLDGCLASGALHGGSFPSRLRDPVVGQVFLVGDAAGQCLPLTGEGIRPALVFGQLAGRLARHVLRDELSLTQALTGYRKAVLRRRPYYRLLERLQRGMLRAPRWSLRGFARLFAEGPLSAAAYTAYWRLADPDALDPRVPSPDGGDRDAGAPSGAPAGRRAEVSRRAGCGRS